MAAVFTDLLQTKAKNLWSAYIDRSELIQTILRGEATRELLEVFLKETVHYTSHNAINQAIVGTKINLTTPELVGYMKFCFHHAYEEVGHEYMALHDLNSLGRKYQKADLGAPLASTQKFIDYIYDISRNLTFARLGYSFWAENSYEYFGHVIKAIMTTLNLKPSQMTFFISHSDIDKEHFEEVKLMVEKYVITAEAQKSVEDALEMSLVLTFDLIDGIYKEYIKNKKSDIHHELSH